MAELFERHVEGSMRRQQSARVAALAAALEVSPSGALGLSAPLPDPRFDHVLSGWYWQIEAADGTMRLRSRSLWDQALSLPEPLPRPGQGRSYEMRGPSGERMLVSERALVFPRGGGTGSLVRIVVAYDWRFVEASASAFLPGIAGPLVALGVFLLLAAWVGVWFGLQPLEQVRRGVNRVRRGGDGRLPGRFPEEVMPLVNEVNHLLEARAAAIDEARNRAFDLAHGLKTPLTVIANDSARLRARGDMAVAEELETMVRDMRRLVDRQLSGARRAAAAGGGAESEIGGVLRGVVTTLKRTPRGEALAWDVRIPGPIVVGIGEEDLAEALGNVFENATKWARRRIEIAVSSTLTACCVDVLDDGPGVPEQRVRELGQRGVRLDEAMDGSGMGLAIVGDIMSACGGEVTFAGENNGSGLHVHLSLPLALVGP